jgi:hypothetical protein
MNDIEIKAIMAQKGYIIVALIGVGEYKYKMRLFNITTQPSINLVMNRHYPALAFLTNCRKPDNGK